MAYAVAVTFTIHPQEWEAFLPLMQANATASQETEAGCLRFDVCTDADHPHQVFLYEVYTDRAAFEAHMKTSHFEAFNAAAGKMIADKSIRTYRSVFHRHD